ncbi:MAG TPA: SDR family oxidoreductase [Verrucomicrobiae bacterium]|nr:SDR family oxidoreductase [Verrucomicrobiae bacterium]
MDDAAPDLSGKSILVTGGSMGIGEVAARTCLEAGARVTICARGRAKLEAAAARFSAAGYAEAIASASIDVSDPAGVERAFDAACTRFGGVDGVIHAAAVLEPIGSILDVEPAAWLRTVEIDLYGTFLVTRAACARMRERGGRIVLFSGGGASSAYPNFTAYACSKVAVVRFAESVATEMAAYRIEINALAPGLVATRMVEQTRRSGVAQPSGMTPVPPERGARAAAFLVSDAARGITGKFVAPSYDDYARWPEHLDELSATDVFTLRRILPKERGMEWQ